MEDLLYLLRLRILSSQLTSPKSETLSQSRCVTVYPYAFPVHASQMYLATAVNLVTA
jgi:hypothetical protein